MCENGCHFSGQQVAAISITERVCSALSVAASCIIIVTFLGSRNFRRPINRLVFYATFGNVMANVGTLISESGVDHGANSALCQFQAFMIQWFVPADSLWAFVMACNVYLAMFHRYRTNHLRPLEWKYFLFCYGLPFVPAFVLLFIGSESRGRTYGPAVQWCWISLKWDYLQIALFYGPVWLIIGLTFCIYARVGIYIFKQHRRLHKYTDTDTTIDSEMPVFVEADANVSDGGHPSIQHQDPNSDQVHPSLDLPNMPGDAQGLGISGSSPEAAAVRAYCKYAVLFFLALLITWVPSSANRVYALSMSNQYLFGLTYASSFVLPLQGFWNTVIYITVSWRVFKLVPAQISRLETRSLPTLLAGRLHRRIWNTPFVGIVKGKLGYT